MTKKSANGVVCLSVLVVGLFFATPLSQRPPLDPSLSAQLGRAEQGDIEETQLAAELTSDREAVCSGTPDQAKGIIEPSEIIPLPSTEKPVFEKDRRSAVLSLIHYPWEELGYNIVFLGSRMGYRAMTLTARRRIEVYVRPGEGLMNQAYDLAHELGHAFDLMHNDEARRRKWCELRGINPSKSWFGCDACPDYNTPAGDFAETFAYLLLGPGNYHSQIAPAPKPEQVAELAVFCRIDKVSDALMVHPSKKPRQAAVQSAKSEAPAATQEKPESRPALEESVEPPNPTETDAENKQVETKSTPAEAATPSEAPKQEAPAPEVIQNSQSAPNPVI